MIENTERTLVHYAQEHGRRTIINIDAALPTEKLEVVEAIIPIEVRKNIPLIVLLFPENVGIVYAILAGYAQREKADFPGNVEALILTIEQLAEFEKRSPSEVQMDYQTTAERMGEEWMMVIVAGFRKGIR